MKFVTESYGKWILAGEHAVLRGAPALVFPATEFVMTFAYEEGKSPLQVNFVGSNGKEIELIFWGLVESALHKVQKCRNDLNGELQIENTIPLGAGLGASAALCVGVSRIFAHKKWILSQDIFSFSRNLESLFHGESSGVDIAVTLEGCGLRFMRGGEWTKVKQNWKPKIYLSYSGHRAITSECVHKVSSLVKSNTSLSQSLDEQMREAVDVAEQSLLKNETDGVDGLVKAFDLAADCFKQWGLCEGLILNHMNELSRAGALAVKPTGSGGGGYVLSLWNSEPSAELLSQLVRI
jgi:mevalonate kinase